MSNDCIEGTTSPSFRVGRRGPTRFQGSASPLVTPPSGAVNGDTYIRTLDNGEGYWQLRDGIWHEIGDMFSVYRVEAAETKIIPTNRQMVIHGELIIDGELEIEGELVLEL